MMNHKQMLSAELSSDRNVETKQASTFMYQMCILSTGHPEWLSVLQLTASLVKIRSSEVFIFIFGYSSNFGCIM